MTPREQASRVLAAVDAAAEQLEGAELQAPGITLHIPVEVMVEVGALVGRPARDIGLTDSGRRVYELVLVRHSVPVTLIGSCDEQAAEVTP